MNRRPTRMLLALGVAAVLAPGAPVASAGATRYAIGKHVCRAPKRSSFARCLAMARVTVTKGSRGAVAFHVAAGATAAGTIGPAGGLTPIDLARAYRLTTTGGAGQTVAIVDAYNDPNIASDLGRFDTQYALAACTTASGCLRVVGQTGGTTLPANDTSGWSVEETLDVEAAHAVCQGCKILLVEANSPSDADLGAAVNEAVSLGATEVSSSYGAPEGTGTAFASDYNHPGVVITASSGDDGYDGFDQLAYTNAPNTPAAYPTVVAVGGTSLYLGQDGTRSYETVWNDNGPQDADQQRFGIALGAGGGGCSTAFAAERWQTSLAGWNSTACGGNRLVADVSALADPLTGFDIEDTYNCGSACTQYGAPGWLTLGGTSLASPIVAAAYGLAGGARGVPYPALTLYGRESSAYDVTTGGNGWCEGEGAAQCGDPNTLGYGIADCDYPAAGTTPSAGDRACDASGGYDGPTGVGTTTITTKGSASHTYASAGNDTLTVHVKDSYGLTATRTYSVAVG